MIPYIPIGPVPVPDTTGTIPFASDVRLGVAVGEGTGTLRVPSPNSVLAGVLVDATTGNYVSPPVGKVRLGTSYGAGGTALVGTDVLPDVEDVRLDTGYGTDGVEFVGTFEGGGGGTVAVDAAVIAEAVWNSQNARALRIDETHENSLLLRLNEPNPPQVSVVEASPTPGLTNVYCSSGDFNTPVSGTHFELKLVQQGAVFMGDALQKDYSSDGTTNADGEVTLSVFSSSALSDAGYDDRYNVFVDRKVLATVTVPDGGVTLSQIVRAAVAE